MVQRRDWTVAGGHAGAGTVALAVPCRMWNDGSMVEVIPSIEEVRAHLLELTFAQLQRLAQASGVPFGTIWKIRAGDTTNPGIETVRRFVGCIATVKEAT